MYRLVCFACVLVAPLLLAACATIPPEQRAANCRATDWHQFGYNDGILGVRATDRNDLFVDCAQVGAPANVNGYQAGRAEGLKQYCTVQTGYNVGYSGRPYFGVCPPELEPGFLQGFNRGRAEMPRYYYYPYYPYYPYWGWGWGWGASFYPTIIIGSGAYNYHSHGNNPHSGGGGSGEHN
jgi:hypothetical protein